MKNRNIIIGLIVLISVICIALIVLMINMMNGKFQLNGFKFSHKVSNELVIDETYDVDFSDVSVTTNASDIYIKVATDNNVRVVIYGDKDNTKVETSNNKLSIISKEKTCVGFCFNTTIAKIEVYLPKNYDKTINVVNNYGDISIDEFLQATIDIEEDCGDVTVSGGNLVSIDNDYGDITLNKAKVANIKESAGDVKIGTVDDVTVENDYGDIEINSVNNYLRLINDCGDIKVDNIILNKNSTIKDDYGDIKIGSTNEVYINAKTDLGDVKITKNYQNSDIVLLIENDCGDIIVNN